MLELALALMVLMSLTMGMVEFGQYLHVRHCFEAAARDGGRYGSLGTATQAQMVTTLTTVLA